MEGFKFIAPNFLAQVSNINDVDDKKIMRILYASTKEKAEELLKTKDFKVHKIEPYDFDNGWLKKAIALSKEVNTKCANGEKFDFNSKPHWGELKEHLFDLSDGKCVFCEVKIKGNQYGDVEHYRPKAAVTGEPNHQGYYWLAYDYENYLPACLTCNQTYKKNHFPIAGQRAIKPGDFLGNEKPLLTISSPDFYKHVKINPSVDQQKAGLAEGLDNIGKACIDVLKLNRFELKDIRAAELTLFRVALKQVVMKKYQDEDDQCVIDFIDKLLKSPPQFYSAKKWEINNYFEKTGAAPPFEYN